MERAQLREGTLSKPVFRRLVEDVLARIRHGALEVRHSDGSIERFGDAHAAPVRLEILSADFYRECVLFGDIGFGESYTRGDWTTPDLKALIMLMIRNMDELGGMSGSKAKLKGNVLKIVNKSAHLLRANTLAGSKKNIQEHYDLSNAFYQLWLDPTMTYSSALWTTPELTLEQAQVAKWRALAESLELKASDKLLEIGTGWGGFACFAAKEYGCQVTTITISKEQHRYATELFRREGVDHLITLHLEDYRKITGTFDKIVSIEMMEAIGHRFLPVFFRVVDRHLKPQGLLSFQVITCPDKRYEEYRKSVDWIQKHIFPGGLLPSVGHLMKVVNDVCDLQLLRFRDFGPHYARTLKEWHERFTRAEADVRKLGFSDNFIRKWRYYLQYCEAAFRMRNVSVVHVTLTRPNNTQLVWDSEV